MKQFFELAPIAAFLIALYLRDIYVATAVLMIATAIQIALMMILKHPITGMQWFVTGTVLIFGALTLFFHDERFIKIKPTIVYAVMAAVFIFSALVLKKNLMQLALSPLLNAPSAVWNTINWQWVGLFIAMALANWVLAYSVSTEIWAWSKLAFVFLTLAFAGWQIYSHRQYLRQDINNKS